MHARTHADVEHDCFESQRTRAHAPSEINPHVQGTAKTQLLVDVSADLDYQEATVAALKLAARWRTIRQSYSPTTNLEFEV